MSYFEARRGVSNELLAAALLGAPEKLIIGAH